jgi:D-alanyl-D-alanine carboxypeptidase
MKNKFRVTYLLFTILSIGYHSFAQQKEDYTTKIDSLIEITNPRSFNGVVYIQQNGKIKYSKAFGYSNFNKKTPLKVTDNFSTMSIAKQITATLILQEVEKGTIDLNTPIRKYLPDFKYSWADTITIHQLLNHTSGLNSDDISKPLKFVSGTAFSYSNIGYAVAGLILEKQSHKSFQELVTELFKKCNMNSSYYPTEKGNRHLTKGHTVKKDGTFNLNDKSKFSKNDFFASHLIVTASDLAKWNECLHNEKLIKRASYKLMTNYSITNAHQLFSNMPIGYGYGLRINDKDSISEIGHTGFHPSEGYTAVNLYYPKTKTSVIVMENQANENFDIAYYFEQKIRDIVRQSKLIQ